MLCYVLNASSSTNNTSREIVMCFYEMGCPQLVDQSCVYDFQLLGLEWKQENLS